MSFINDDLFPYLKALGSKPGATNKQKVIAEIISNKEKTILASETNIQNALDKIHDLTEATISDQHMFPISQAFEGLLPSLGEKKNDGGQFFTPREVIRVIVNAVKPQLGKTVYDPCCGTGGFLIEAYKSMMKQKPTDTQIDALKFEDFNDFFERLALDPDDPKRVSEWSWYVSIEDIKKKNYDFKATNENAPDLSDKRTPEQLFAIIQEAQEEIAEGLKRLMT
ncbi:MAG: N-6 DNA methylase [Desulfobacterales bacterium]|nr:N-6 DNA methylase [Desulfobacterales bacterium]